MANVQIYQTAHLRDILGGLIFRNCPSPIPFRRNLHMTRVQQTATTGSTASSTTSKVHPVVSTFLCTGQPGTPSFRVAILRRRRASHVYAGKWAVISGSIKVGIDASPLAAALRELQEETMLGETDVDVLVHGQPYDAPDHDLDIIWRIHPFLTKIKVREAAGVSTDSGEEAARSLKARIALDEEHDGLAFVGQDEVASYDTVDGLTQTLSSLVDHYKTMYKA